MRGLRIFVLVVGPEKFCQPLAFAGSVLAWTPKYPMGPGSPVQLIMISLPALAMREVIAAGVATLNTTGTESACELVP